jgi:hypothetical protein
MHRVAERLRKAEGHSMKRLAFTLVVALLAAIFGPRGSSAMALARAQSPQQTAVADAAQPR